jgi:hypothetical protein
MKMLRNIKYLNIVLFVLLLLFVVLIMATIQQHEVERKVYFYLAMIVVSGVTFLGINLWTIGNKKNEQSRVSDIISDDAVDQQIEKSEEITEEVNFKEWADNLLKKAKKENIEAFAESLLGLLSKEFEVVQGLYFNLEKKSGNFIKMADYAYYSDVPPREFMIGETISGQVAKNQKVMKITDIPEGYITVLSGLGSSSPSNLLIMPLINENETIGIVELAFFREPIEKEMNFFEELAGKAGKVAGKFLTEKSSELKK